MQLIVFPLQNGDATLERVAVVIRDMSEQRNIERQILDHQQSSMVSQVAVAVAHQLRNPLGVMIGFSEMLATGLPTPQVPDAIEKIHRNGLRCKQIVEDLLSVGRIAPEEREPVDISTLLRTLLRLRFQKDKAIAWTWNIPSETLWVQGTVHLFTEAFNQILKNAVRAAKKQVKVDAQIEGTMIAIRIYDDGDGIVANHFEDLFLPFYTTYKEKGHIGLGLSLARSVIQEYEGQLNVEHVDAGAAFLVRLPLIAGSQNEAASTVVADAAQDPPAQQSVLVVDDEQDLLEMLEAALTMQGYQVDTALSAREGIRLLDENLYDAVVLDVLMPGSMGGREVYDYLQNNKPHLLDVTLFITADTVNVGTRQFLSDIPQNHLEKPFLMRDFVNAVQELLDNQDAKKY